MRSQWFLDFTGQVFRAAWLGAGLTFVALGAAGTAWAGSAPPPPTPEIDPGAMGSALAFLTGSTFILVDRLRRK